MTERKISYTNIRLAGGIPCANFDARKGVEIRSVLYARKGFYDALGTVSVANVSRAALRKKFRKGFYLPDEYWY